ncbi:hypothetical protein [Kitasatospora sp. NPDC093679]|uniref:hypothetical protein n=1 Tax=Kitasatospora sp. NPDC093679 TaxID=3154983 RepID=UPI0034302612
MENRTERHGNGGNAAAEAAPGSRPATGPRWSGWFALTAPGVGHGVFPGVLSI